jgi:hypothetical protein
VSPKGLARLAAGAWLAAVVLLGGALTGAVTQLWPALPLWVVPAGVAGAACLMIAGLRPLALVLWYGVRGARKGTRDE